MKIPKLIKRYCPKCRKHTEHRVSIAKKKTLGTAHPLSYGGKKRAKARGERRGHGNLGRYSKPPGGGKMTGKKQTKKTDFRFQCRTCNKMFAQKRTLRAGKVEIK